MILQLTSGVCILISIGTDIAGPSCLLFIGFTCGHHVFRAQSPSAKGGAPGGTKAKEGHLCLRSAALVPFPSICARTHTNAPKSDISLIWSFACKMYNTLYVQTHSYGNIKSNYPSCKKRSKKLWVYLTYCIVYESGTSLDSSAFRFIFLILKQTFSPLL